MKQKSFILFVFITLMFFLGCCKKDGDPEIVVTIQEPSEVVETSFTVNWEINSDAYDSLVIEVSCTDNFNELASCEVITEKDKNSQVMDGLNGKTIYYYRIVVWSHNKSSITVTEQVRTNCASESVQFKTDDNILLSGTVYYLDNGREKKPGIVFMHEFGYMSHDPAYFYPINGWVSSRVMSELIASDYVCMFFFDRGHGASEDFDIEDLHYDPVLENYDLKAAIGFLQNHERVHPDSIALVGASMGSRLATMGNCLDGVKLSVAVSYHLRNPVDYNCPGVKPKNMLIIAGENEYIPLLDLRNIDWAGEALVLYNKCAEPKKLYIEPEATEHGTNLLNYAGVNSEIIDWIKTHL